jgi:hypothetical protein
MAFILILFILSKMKIVPSIYFNDLRGKVGQSVISKNIHGLYTKQLVIPSKSNQTQNIAVRTRYSQIAASWRGLSSVQKALWSSAAPTYTFVNNVGVSYHPTGFQLFVYCNMNIWPYYSTFITVPSNYVAQTIPDLDNDPLVAGSGTCNLNSWTLSGATNLIQLYCSYMLPKSSNAFVYPAKYSIGFLANHAAPINIYSALVACLGTPPVVDYKYFLRATNTSTVYGIVSADFALLGLIE